MWVMEAEDTCSSYSSTTRRSNTITSWVRLCKQRQWQSRNRCNSRFSSTNFNSRNISKGMKLVALVGVHTMVVAMVVLCSLWQSISSFLENNLKWLYLGSSTRARCSPHCREGGNPCSPLLIWTGPGAGAMSVSCIFFSSTLTTMRARTSTHPTWQGCQHLAMRHLQIIFWLTLSYAMNSISTEITKALIL